MERDAPACNRLTNRLALTPSPRQLRVENDLHCRTCELSARIRALPRYRAELDGPLDDTDRHSSIGWSPAAGVGYSMRPLARLVFLDAVFGIGGVRHLETALSARLDSSAKIDLSSSGARISADRSCVPGLGTAPIGRRKFLALRDRRSETAARATSGARGLAPDVSGRDTRHSEAPRLPAQTAARCRHWSGPRSCARAAA